MKLTESDINFVMQEIRFYKSVCISHLHDFYEDMCKYFNFDCNDILKSKRKIRQILHAMVKMNLLEVTRMGTGKGGVKHGIGYNSQNHYNEKV